MSPSLVTFSSGSSLPQMSGDFPSCQFFTRGSPTAGVWNVLGQGSLV